MLKIEAISCLKNLDDDLCGILAHGAYPTVG